MRIIDYTETRYYVAQVKGGREVAGSRIECESSDEARSTIAFLATIEPRSKFITISKARVYEQDRLI